MCRQLSKDGNPQVHFPDASAGGGRGPGRSGRKGRRHVVGGFLAGLVTGLLVIGGAAGAESGEQYLLLATNRTGTMNKEMNRAAAEGYRLGEVMGGQTSFGGAEVVLIMKKEPEAAAGRFQYRLLATSKTSTMQKELQDAADEGFEYRAQTVFETAFGGKEVVIILEKDREDQSAGGWEYRLLATKKTSTMQKELDEAGEAGYELVGLTVGDTAFGGNELVCLLKRRR